MRLATAASAYSNSPAGCYSCNIHIHSAYASFFQETISSFAHPSHTLKLSRSPAPGSGLTCDICRGYCPPEGFAYRCSIGCGFDVHPLCAMLPERVTGGSRFHPGHGLRMVSSSSRGCCSACRHPLHDLRYVCSCSTELHITCAIAIDPASAGAAAGEVRNGTAPAAGGYGGRGSLQGWYDYGPASAFQGYGGRPANQGWHYGYSPAGYNNNNCYYHPAAIQGYGQGYHPIQGGYYSNTPGGYGSTGGSVQSIFANPSFGLMTTIAKFLLDMEVVNTPVSDFLSGLFNN